MSELRKLLGTSPLRLEDPRLLRGDGRYLADLKLHGMVHAAVLRSPLPSARIRSIDTAAARADPRAVHVITAADLPAFGGLPCFSAPPDTTPCLQPVLATDTVRYVGEPVAVALAESRHDAEDLLELIEVDWEPLPAVLSVQEAQRPDAPLVHPDTDTNVVARRRFVQGDPAAIDAAPHRLARQFSFQRQAGVPLETRGVLADWDPALERLTVTLSTQCPHVIRDVVAGFVGLPADGVRVVVPDVGGAFGTKNNVYPEELVV
ncbi:MAG: xanthine dehydrogenase family protein molybdopterin-binding subunit, partial [Pseudonocardia sp.]|nr:xanthine dehydrogenase family protein molybdopterin-binding subunit [Pseudonocardia sp.]